MKLGSVYARSRKNIKPKLDTSNLNSGDKRRGVLSVPGGDTAPTFQVQEGVFNQVAQTIQIYIIITLDFAVFLWRYHDFHVLRQGLLNDLLAVISLVGQKPPGIYPVNQGFSLLTIVDGTRCNKYSDRHTIRIHGQMYLRVKPPFVRSMSWFPPTAPAA